MTAREDSRVRTAWLIGVALLVLAGCASGRAPPREEYARAFDLCYEPVRARSCGGAGAAGRDACMERIGLRYDGAHSRSDRRALLVSAGCPAEVVDGALGIAGAPREGR